MAIKWHEERIGRIQFPVDEEGAKVVTPFLPLRSEWLLRATGMWVRVWSWSELVPAHDLPDYAGEFQVWKMNEFEGQENSLPRYETMGGRSETDMIGPDGAPGSPLPQRLYGTVQTSSGFGCGGSRFYELPNTGAAYPALALQVYPINNAPEDEPQDFRLCDPIWTAARILYRVEH